MLRKALRGAATILVATLALFALCVSPARATPMRASYYGAESGSHNADGSRFVPMGFTAAHRTLPFGTRLRVCLRGCVTVVVRDRGPFIRGRDLDLSHGAARAIGLDRAGVATIAVDIIGRAEPARTVRHRQAHPRHRR